MIANAQPVRELGSKSPGGLMLPDAKPAPHYMYAPRGAAFLPEGGLAVCDTGNHRILIWHRLPDEDHAPADVVLGQPSFTHEGPQAAGAGPENGLHLPCGIAVLEGRLYVCDAWNHRVLIWNAVPTESGAPPDAVLGQPSLGASTKNRGGSVGPSGLDCPYGLAAVDGDLYVCDTQNRRVLVWDGIPTEDRPADWLMGQDDFTRSEENRASGPGPHTYRWPHAIATAGGRLFVADAGNHRILGWSKGRDRQGPADILLGQESFDTAWEMPHVAQGPGRLRFPYGLVSSEGRLITADTANNRILTFTHPVVSHGAEAEAVLGQHSFDTAGENRWDVIAPDTLCWPYGLALEGDCLAVCDSGNNRVVLWRLQR
ncbi:MAG: NHL repeat-containing protein [Planctomycetota bacterium]